MSIQQKAQLKLRLKPGYRWKLLLLYFRRERPRFFSLSGFAAGLIEQIVDKAILDGEISPISQEDKSMDAELNIEEQYEALLRQRGGN